MPFDPTVAIVFGTMLCALVLSLSYAAWYQNMKRQTSARRTGGDSSRSVGLSELEGLLRKVVAEGVEPLEVRISSLEAEIRSRTGGSGEGVPALPAGETSKLRALPADERAQEFLAQQLQQR